MTARHLNIGAVGSLGIFNLVAEGLAFRSREPDAIEEGEADVSDAPRRSLLDRIDDWFWRRHQRSVEMRLAQAADIFELERMVRGLDRGDISLHG